MSHAWLRSCLVVWAVAACGKVQSGAPPADAPVAPPADAGSGDAPPPPVTRDLLAGNIGGVGNADDTGVAARFRVPRGVARDASGNLYVADTSNHTIRKITPAGVVTTFAGTAGLAGSTDATGAAARFKGPENVAIDSAGTLYVADTGNATIRKITPAGVVTTLAGTPGVLGGADGTGPAASFEGVVGEAFDSAGNLYVTDTIGQTIRKVTPTGVVTTIAGAFQTVGTADGPGTTARFNIPTGVAIDSAGSIYVGDQLNHTIRQITQAGVVTTIAGLAGTAGTSDGVGADARFHFPTYLTIVSANNLYVSDNGNRTLRKITPTGIVSKIAGASGVSGSDDGGAAARLHFPTGSRSTATAISSSPMSTIRRSARSRPTAS